MFWRDQKSKFSGSRCSCSRFLVKPFCKGAGRLVSKILKLKLISSWWFCTFKIFLKASVEATQTFTKCCRGTLPSHRCTSYHPYLLNGQNDFHSSTTGYIPRTVCECVARETGCVGGCVASTGDGVPQQADPGSDVHVHLTSTQEGFTWDTQSGTRPHKQEVNH